MTRRLLILITSLCIAGCSEKITGTDTPAGKGEYEKSYISVTLKSDDASTRADGLEEGEAEERYVENAHFFLFKSDGSAFPVNPAENRNYITFDFSANGTEPGTDPNISDVKDKILVFNSYKGEYPAYIVAVLNWDERHIQAHYSLNNLYNTLADIRNDNDHFIMSTSAYADMQGQKVYANTWSLENIGKTEEEAMAHPVEIYVERISAKVQVEAKGDVAGKDAVYDTKQSVEGIPVYAKVVKWELYNDYHQSIILKHIYPETWGMADQIGFLWNDPNRFRSYWATSYSGSFPADNHFDWLNNGLEPGASAAYCGENTRQAEKDGEGNIISDPRTKVIVKAQLVNADGDAFEVVNWYGHDYIGELNVRKEVASLLASKIFYSEGGEYKSITETDIRMVNGSEAPAGSGIEAYEVFFQLDESAAAKDWYTYSNSEGYLPATDDETDAYLATVEPALLYRNGMTYYFTEIRHFGSTGSDSEFGVVRNHIYKVNISDISGFGTPVSDQETDVEVPERPKDVKSYVAAEVRILSWKVVKNDYSVN